MSGISTRELVLTFLIIVILFAISKYFWNLMSEVKRMNGYLEAQTKLLAESAVKNGVEIDTVSDITAQAGIKSIKKL